MSRARYCPVFQIVLTNEDTGVFREVTSGEDGSYFVSALTPGRYRLAAKLPGFRNFERRGLVVPQTAEPPRGQWLPAPGAVRSPVRVLMV